MKHAVIGSFLLLATNLIAQAGTSQQDIVQTIMPHGVPTELRIPNNSDKPHCIELLKAARVQARGKRAQQIAFLLAAMGSDYAANRAFLVHALRGCSVDPIHDCDEDTAAFVASLFQRGDDTLLEPLLKIGPKSDGALSESLGDFYADVLVHNTAKFLDGIQSFPPSVQKNLCTLAGGTDGSGMAPEDLQQVRKNLRRIGSPDAQRCLRAVDAINKKINSADKAQ